MLNFAKHSERKKAEDFAKKVLRCARRISRLIKEWEEVCTIVEEIEKEKARFETLFPLIGESKCAYLLGEVHTLSQKTAEFRKRITEMTNPFNRLGE